RKKIMTNYVYNFGAGAADGDGKMKEILGGKGAGLAEMTRAGVPVPPGFTITTEACLEFYRLVGRFPHGLQAAIDAAMSELDQKSRKGLGYRTTPLLVSVRSGARVSMPGMMDTILNLGLNDTTVEGLAKESKDARFAWDSYRRFIQMYGSVVLGVDHHHFEEIIEHAKMRAGVIEDTALTVDDWR